jgi:DNA-binding XRE family transcriptional regulator
MISQSITLNGKRYVVVPQDEYEGLRKAAQLPPLPEPDEHGNYPAVAYGRASLAREIILDRIRLGLTQRELARRAGIRVETLCRIESGKVTPTITSIEKIDRAIKQIEAGQPAPARDSSRKPAATKPRRSKTRQPRRR